ncbi:hypothetical protein MKK88_12175 [Methylobacterium sp. E-005]|uniref:hypothetical protein n=1 Tax=Methylobacterium sp. E-005 TaxID=2836549 RepID=UPI001FBB9921|nr:hypothetical protein [Methylobacterium sp. E-005]MCJ2086742.1 hypothetical protein [Methylobacterium sp. E-005]
MSGSAASIRPTRAVGFAAGEPDERGEFVLLEAGERQDGRDLRRVHFGEHLDPEPREPNDAIRPMQRLADILLTQDAIECAPCLNAGVEALNRRLSDLASRVPC